MEITAAIHVFVGSQAKVPLKAYFSGCICKSTLLKHLNLVHLLDVELKNGKIGYRKSVMSQYSDTSERKKGQSAALRPSLVFHFLPEPISSK